MAHVLNVYALPTLAVAEDLEGGVAVTIDVLRASTTIIHALEAGAAEVVPCVEVDQAHEAASAGKRGYTVLGGERGGLKIDGFDLGNSPEEYTPERVAGKTVVFTTSNGTRAIERCLSARRVLIGGFVNAESLCRELAGERKVHLLCAGTRGRMSNDDILLAGLIVQRLERHGDIQYAMNAQAITARETWQAAFALPVALGAETLDPRQLAARLETTAGGRQLIKIGLEQDILAAAQLDRFQCVPEFDFDRCSFR